MPTIAEALRALEGSLAIARRDPDASRFFDLSAGSFWRSFGVVIYLVPIFVFFLAVRTRMSVELGDTALEPMPGFLVLILSDMLTLGIEWVGYPLAMYFLTRTFGLAGRFAAYIIVYNWTSLAVTLVMVPPYLLYAAGLLPAETAVVINLVTVLAVIWFRWVIAREVLAAPGISAAGFVALDLVMSLFINLVIASVFFGTP